MKKSLLIVFILLYLHAQSQQQGWGGMAGLSMSFGWPVNRLGVMAGAFYFYDFIEVNTQYRVFYNFSTFAPVRSGPEFQGTVGGVLAYGMKSDLPATFMDANSNHTGRHYSASFAYNYYLDRHKTSQPTGTIGFQFGRWQVITENDVFVAVLDQYRTATLGLQYTVDEFYRFGVATILWTGHSNRQPRIRGTDYPGRFGYFDMSQAPYGNRSHGILCLYADRALAFAPYQAARAAIGLDDERVRHFFQNRIIHDMMFIPDAWIPHENPQIPMIDKDGNAYLYKEGQEIRPSQLYLHLGMNPPQFY